MKNTMKLLEWARATRRRRVLACTVFFVAMAFLAGCHRDPNIAKQKYLESGKRYSAEGKWREAAIQFSNALKIDKNFPDAHYQLAQTYMHAGQLGPAFAEFRHTVDLQPANYDARIALGNLLVAGGKVDDAKAQADAVLAAQPNNPDAHALLSGISNKRGDRDKALSEMYRAIDLDPERAIFHEDLALLFSGDPRNAASMEAELKKALSLDPKLVDPRIMLATFYMKSNRWAEAEQAGWSAVAANPKSLSARESLAHVFFTQGEEAKAEQVLRQASQDLADNPQGVRVLADYYMSSGQFDKARTEFANLAARYHSNVSVQKGYVRALIQVNDINTARTVVAALLKSSPKDPEVIALNGIVLIHDGKAGDAVNALELAVRDSPKDPFLQYWLGRAASTAGNSDLAEKSFLAVEKLAPAMLAAEEELARTASMRGDMSLLADVADKTIAAVPRFPGGYLWRAIVEMSHHAPDKAEADLKTAISVAPQDFRGYLEYGKLRFAQHRFPEGVALLEQALQYNPDSVEALGLLIGYDLDQKQPGKALARLNTQIGKRPQNSGFYDLLAQLKMQSKKTDEAIAAARKAMQLDPNDAEAIQLFARNELQTGQAANAVAAWQQWVNSHPGDASALALLGTLEESRGNRSQAEADYKKALELQPRQSLAANNLAYLMLENGENSDVAMTLAQTARQSLPNSPSTADTLAWAYYYKGVYAFARDLLEDAVKSEPNNSVMQYHLGMAYTKLQDKSDAAIHLKRAIALDPNSSTAKDARAALGRLG